MGTDDPKNPEEALKLCIDRINAGVDATRPDDLPESVWFIDSKWIEKEDSFFPGDSGTTIYSRTLVKFKGQWKDGKGWEVHGRQVRLMAFYIGALTSYNAAKMGQTAITKQDFQDARVRVRDECKEVLQKVAAERTPNPLEPLLAWCE